MRRTLLFTSIAAALVLSFSSEAVGQRRARPGAMKHTEQEAADALKETKVKATYIRDGATFVGDIYLTGDAGGIKMGTATIKFSNGKYWLSFINAKFDVQETSRTGRKYWKKQKLGEDFSYGGAYEVIEKGKVLWLKLYESDSTDGYCDKIELTSKDDKAFEFQQDNMLMRMQYRGY
ncbi:MAG: hypothetical protein K2N25_03035 [Muribaculaceae bacterium]|nr:hypothetical protein [Muribaculaceae bacterium]